MKEHKHAEILRAIADGREVEYRQAQEVWKAPQKNGDGSTYENPVLHTEWEWRIKPEPKPDYVTYIRSDATCYDEIYHTNYKPKMQWKLVIKVTWDGETNAPKSVELVK